MNAIVVKKATLQPQERESSLLFLQLFEFVREKNEHMINALVVPPERLELPTP
jgi:hypothetical protein